MASWRTQNQGHGVAMTANGAIPVARFVKVDTTADNTVVLPAAATDLVIGVTDTSIDDTKAGKIVLDGVVRLEAAEALTLGAKVGTDANGKGVIAGVGEKTFGVVVEPATADGEIASVLLTNESVTL